MGYISVKRYDEPKRAHKDKVLDYHIKCDVDVMTSRSDLSIDDQLIAIASCKPFAISVPESRPTWAKPIKKVNE